MIKFGGMLKNWVFHLCFIYTIQRMVCQLQAVFPPVLTKYPKEIGTTKQSADRDIDLFWKTVFVHNTQFTIDLRLVTDSNSPSFHRFKVARYNTFSKVVSLG